MAKKKSEPKETPKEVQKVEQHHDCEVCGEKAVCNDTGSGREGNHWYCLKHHQYWCKCITHEKMVAMHKKEKV